MSRIFHLIRLDELVKGLCAEVCGYVVRQPHEEHVVLLCFCDLNVIHNASPGRAERGASPQRLTLCERLVGGTMVDGCGSSG